MRAHPVVQMVDRKRQVAHALDDPATVTIAQLKKLVDHDSVQQPE
jgi:hypothetical protein